MARKLPKDSRVDSIITHMTGGERSSTFFAGLTVPLDEFVRAQSARLARIASKVKVPPDQIADVVQAVWLDAVRNGVTFRGENAVRARCAWLGRVVLRRSADALRSLQRRAAESLEAEPVDEEAKDAPTLLDV
jgi:DNA-directed RNA polymerase specialized sigma24 family protein